MKYKHLIKYLESCKKYNHEFFYTNPKPIHWDDSTHIVNCQNISDLEERKKIVKDLNELMEEILNNKLNNML